MKQIRCHEWLHALQKKNLDLAAAKSKTDAPSSNIVRTTRNKVSPSTRITRASQKKLGLGATKSETDTPSSNIVRTTRNKIYYDVESSLKNADSRHDHQQKQQLQNNQQLSSR